MQVRSFKRHLPSFYNLNAPLGSYIKLNFLLNAGPPYLEVSVWSSYLFKALVGWRVLKKSIVCSSTIEWLTIQSANMASYFHLPPATVTEPSLWKKEPSPNKCFPSISLWNIMTLAMTMISLGSEKSSWSLIPNFHTPFPCSLHIHPSKQEYSCHTWLERSPWSFLDPPEGT